MKKILKLVLAFAMVCSSITCIHADDTSEHANIVVFAHFTDDTQESADTYFNDHLSQIKGFYDGNQRSLSEYLKTVSYGQYAVRNIFVQDTNGNVNSVSLSMSQDYAKNNNCDGTIMHEILEQMPSVKDLGVDLDGDGIIDNISVILKAENTDSVASGNTLVPHSNTSGKLDEKKDGYEVSNYNLLNTYRLIDSNTAGESGLIIHEYLHTLEYPDLYPTSGDSIPVGAWDIMGSATSWPGLPLAYLRSDNCKQTLSNWMHIDEVKESCSLELHTQYVNDGHQAYILKSPFSDTEFFVVEYRRCNGTRYDGSSLDATIADYPGVIVYRVDTTVEDLSNKSTNPAIYIFRQNSSNLYSASMSKQNNFTQIGNEDISSTENALTFNDGTNSGIVISNVSEATENGITLDVTIPKETSYDLWKNTNFPTQGNQYDAYTGITVANIQDTLTAVEYHDHSFIAYQKENENWKQISSALSADADMNFKLFSYNNKTYFMYYDYNQGCVLKELNNGKWMDIDTVASDGNSFSIEEINGSLYLAYIKDSKNAVLSKWNGSKFEDVGTYYIGSNFIGQVAVTGKEDPYVFVREPNGNILYGYEYKNNQFTKITDDQIKVGTYDCKILNDTLYVSSTEPTSSKVQISTYNNQKWQTQQSDIDSSEAKMTMMNGHIYIISSSSTGSNGFKIYLYDNNQFIQEGDSYIDSDSRNFTVTSDNENIYLSYVRSVDYKSFIKNKKANTEHITKTDLSNAEIKNSKDGIQVQLNGVTLVKDTDYTLEQKDNTVTITGINTYQGTATKEFKDITKIKINDIEDQTYTGKEIKPEIKIEGLEKDKDYLVSYKNNTDIGKATIVIQGINDYINTQTIEFNIKQKKKTMDEIALENKDVIKDGIYEIESSLDDSYVIGVKDNSDKNLANVELQKKKGNASQRWKVTHDSKGYVSFENVKSGKMLDLDKGGVYNYSNVQQYESNGQYPQKWIVLKDDKGMRIIPSVSRDFSLDLSQGNVSAGANIQLYSDLNNKPQRWFFTGED